MLWLPPHGASVNVIDTLAQKEMQRNKLKYVFIQVSVVFAGHYITALFY